MQEENSNEWEQQLGALQCFDSGQWGSGTLQAWMLSFVYCTSQDYSLAKKVTIPTSCYH